MSADFPVVCASRLPGARIVLAAVRGEFAAEHFASDAPSDTLSAS